MMEEESNKQKDERHWERNEAETIWLLDREWIGNDLCSFRVRMEAEKIVETTVPVQARDGGHLNWDHARREINGPIYIF